MVEDGIEPTGERNRVPTSDSDYRIGRKLKSGFKFYTGRWTLLSVATLLYWISTQALRPYMSLHLTDLGASETQIGLAIAAHPFLSMFLAIPAGRLLDERGIRKYLVVSLVLMSLVGAGYAVAGTVAHIFILQMAAGLSELGAWVAIQTLITQAGEGETRARHLALFSLMWGVGIAVGPSIGAWLYDSAQFPALAALYGGCSLAALAAVAGVPYRDSTRPAPLLRDSAPRTTTERLLAMARRPSVLAVLLASFVTLWANSLRTSFYPIFLVENGASLRLIGFLISLAGVTTLIIRIALPWLLRRFRSGLLLVLAVTALVVALTATPLLRGSGVALAIASAVFGLGFGLANPLTLELMTQHTQVNERGLAMGMRVAANRVAQVLQPIAFGVVAGPFGMATGFLSAGLVMAGGTAWTAVATRNADRERTSEAAPVEPMAPDADFRE